MLKRFWLRFHDKHLRDRKLKLAEWLDRKYPGKYCWADCVTWAYSSQRLNPFKIDDSKNCETESKEHSTKMCYCGGWENGQCFAKLPQAEKDAINAERQLAHDSEIEQEILF